jgi:hypothetical protein
MQPARGVFLDDELIAGAACRAPARLGRHVELAFAMIDLEAHGQLARWSGLSTKHACPSAAPLPTRQEGSENRSCTNGAPGAMSHPRCCEFPNRRTQHSADWFRAPK